MVAERKTNKGPLTQLHGDINTQKAVTQTNLPAMRLRKLLSKLI